MFTPWFAVLSMEFNTLKSAGYCHGYKNGFELKVVHTK